MRLRWLTKLRKCLASKELDGQLAWVLCTLGSSMALQSPTKITHLEVITYILMHRKKIGKLTNRVEPINPNQPKQPILYGNSQDAKSAAGSKRTRTHEAIRHLLTSWVTPLKQPSKYAEKDKEPFDRMIFMEVGVKASFLQIKYINATVLEVQKQVGPLSVQPQSAAIYTGEPWIHNKELLGLSAWTECGWS